MQEIYDKKIQYIVGTVTGTIYENFKNPLSPYSIFEVLIQETNMEIENKIRIILQATPPEKNSHVYKFFGHIDSNEKYGISFKCSTYIRNIPIDSSHVIEFLSSGLFHGIKRKRAEKIVKILGEDCLIQIVNSPELLRQVKGIPEETIASIQETIVENLGMQKIISKLHEWNISLNLAKKIFRLYGDASVQRIVENPYCLTNTIRGISFKKADEIAEKVEIRGTDNRRIKGVIEHALHEIYENDGSTFAYKGDVMKKTDEILYKQDNLHYPANLLDENLTELISTDVTDLEGFTTEIGQIRQVRNRIYLAKYHSFEQQIAEKLQVLHPRKENQSDAKIDILLDHYINIRESLSFSFSDEQELAIIESMMNNVLVITGGPGTGKSTVVKSILMLYQQVFKIQDYKQFLKQVILLAPTGRAAKRMTEITDIPAKTIHQFLFTREKEEQVKENRLFIIDEMSMIDIGIMNQFMEYLHKGDRIILVGDKDQLPPVKAGNVFKDIIDSHTFPIIELKTVFRQQHQSTINDLADSIRKGDISEALLENTEHVKWLSVAKNEIVITIQSELLSALNRNIPFEDIQIIAPIHGGEQGIKFINKYIQNLVITHKIPLKTSCISTGFDNRDYSFYSGDRVIQLKNDSKKKVSNGDLGIIIGSLPAFTENQVNEKTGEMEVLEEAERLIVRFNKVEVLYYREEMDELALAYCFSVHKAQGSEFPYVLLPVSSSYTGIMNRNLLYTAITRAKKEVLIIGELNIFLRGLEKTPRHRFTFLKEMLIKS